MNSTKVWLNDELVDADKATVSIFDHGFTVGDGAFETLKVIKGQPVAITRHIKRLIYSLNTIGIELNSEDILKKAINEVILANKSLGEVMRMRITYTSGVGPLGSDRTKDNFTLVVAVSPEAIWPETAIVATVTDPRNDKSMLAGSKTTSLLKMQHYFQLLENLVHTKQSCPIPKVNCVKEQVQIFLL